MIDKKLLTAVLVTAIVVGAGFYIFTPKKTRKPVTGRAVEDIKSYLQGASQSELNDILSSVSNEKLKKACPEEKLKAGFIYVGPVQDYGWTYAHDRARKIVDKKFDWLETTYAESVKPSEVKSTIDSMFNNGVDVVFTTSFPFMQPTLEAAKKWPNKILYHCSGFKQSKNVGSYFSDFYQIYYLNGLAAGALAKNDKIGYIMAHPTSEVIRHANSFYLGAKEVNPDVKMKVLVTGKWYDPATVTTETETLIDWGAKAIAFTQDSPAVIREAQKHYEETGERVYSFSHYTPMKSEGKDVVVSGQLVKWEKWYEPLLRKAKQGKIENTQHWGLLHGGYVKVGATWNETINPKFKDDLKEVKVKDPVLGKINVYNLIHKRLKQFKQKRVLYEPFTGPIYDTEGNLRLKKGEKISTQDLRWNMNWYVKGIIPPK